MPTAPFEWWSTPYLMSVIATPAAMASETINHDHDDVQVDSDSDHILTHDDKRLHQSHLISLHGDAG